MPATSALANRSLQFISQGREVLIPTANIGYSGRLQIVDRRTGRREVLAEAMQYRVGKWSAVADAAPEALLEGYTTDMVQRLTVDYPAVPGCRWFRPGVMLAGIEGGPIPEEVLRHDLLGTVPMGVARLVLSDAATAATVRRGPEVPHLATVERVLRRGLPRIRCSAFGRSRRHSCIEPGDPLHSQTCKHYRADRTDRQRSVETILAEI